MPTVHWSRRVQLNGRSFVFARLDSFQESSPEQKVSYKDGDFVVEGKGPITVNGFVIEVQDGHVLLAEQRVELSPEDEVHFDRSMSWSFRRRDS